MFSGVHEETSDSTSLDLTADFTKQTESRLPRIYVRVMIAGVRTPGHPARVSEADSSGPRAGMAPIVAIEERSRLGTGRRKSARVNGRSRPCLPVARSQQMSYASLSHSCMQIGLVDPGLIVHFARSTQGLVRGICRITLESSIPPARFGRADILPGRIRSIHGESKSVAMQLCN